MKRLLGIVYFIIIITIYIMKWASKTKAKKITIPSPVDKLEVSEAYGKTTLSQAFRFVCPKLMVGGSSLTFDLNIALPQLAVRGSSLTFRLGFGSPPATIGTSTTSRFPSEFVAPLLKRSVPLGGTHHVTSSHPIAETDLRRWKPGEARANALSFPFHPRDTPNDSDMSHASRDPATAQPSPYLLYSGSSGVLACHHHHHYHRRRHL